MMSLWISDLLHEAEVGIKKVCDYEVVELVLTTWTKDDVGMTLN